MNKRRIGKRVAVAALVGASMAAAPPFAWAATVAVTMRDNTFSSNKVTIARGDSVKWTNRGSATHTATGDATLNLFNSGSKAPGQSFTFAFKAAGLYKYHCNLHSTMKGTVTVPITVAPTSARVGQTFTVSLSSAAAPSGYKHHLYVQAPGTDTFKKVADVTTATATVSATKAGTYSFKARLYRTSDKATTGYTPVVTATVS